MSRNKLAVCCVFLGTILGSVCVGHEASDPRKWSSDPRMTGIQPTGKAPAVPLSNSPSADMDAKPRIIHRARKILTVNSN